MQKIKYTKEEKQKYLDELIESGLGSKEWSQLHGIPRGASCWEISALQTASTSSAATRICVVHI